MDLTQLLGAYGDCVPDSLPIPPCRYSRAVGMSWTCPSVDAQQIRFRLVDWDCSWT